MASAAMQNEANPGLRLCELAKAHPPSSVDFAAAAPSLMELLAATPDIEPTAPTAPPDAPAPLPPASPGIAPDGPSASSAVRDNTA
jgi:hypothetical protein